MSAAEACALTPTFACLAQEVDKQNLQTRASVDVFYFLFAASLVFFMQAGFAMLCAGSVRAKNVKNIMLKNLLDACGGAIGFWSLGWAFAYGGASSEKRTFIGDTDFFLSGGGTHHEWFFQFAFAATAATIVAGTVAERCSMIAYICYSMMLTGFVYPVVVHSIWSTSGFFSAFTDEKFLGVGVVDFAGSGVVHLTGGCCALLAAIVLGPRLGRFTDQTTGEILPEPKDMPGHSSSLQMLGTFILWTGWYGFNPGSTLGVTWEGAGDVASLSAVTTTISAASGCVAALAFTFAKSSQQGEKTYDLTSAMNGALGGLVAITAGCSVVQPWAAVVIGALGGVLYCLASSLLLKLRIDDTVDAVPVHMANGIWGMIAVGLFADPKLKAVAYGGNTKAGLFYAADHDGGADLLWCQLVAVILVILWVTCLMYPFFLMLNKFGLFRVSQIDEEVGLDISKHGGAAYEMSGPSADALKDFQEKMNNSGHGASKTATKTTSNAVVVQNPGENNL